MFIQSSDYLEQNQEMDYEGAMQPTNEILKNVVANYLAFETIVSQQTWVQLNAMLDDKAANNPALANYFRQHFHDYLSSELESSINCSTQTLNENDKDRSLANVIHRLRLFTHQSTKSHTRKSLKQALLHHFLEKNNNYGK